MVEPGLEGSYEIVIVVCQLISLAIAQHWLSTVEWWEDLKLVTTSSVHK